MTTDLLKLSVVCSGLLLACGGPPSLEEEPSDVLDRPLVGSVTPAVPNITSISPTSAAPGAVVTITGAYFDRLLGRTAAFGSTNGSALAQVQYVSSTRLTAVVPSGATLGKISLVHNLLGGQWSTQASSPQTFTPLVPPAAPSGLTATVVSDTEVRLSWADNSWNETQFEVSMQTGTSGWSTLGVVGANHTSEPVDGLQPRTTYGFRLRAINGSGTSAYSNVATATTPFTSATVWVRDASAKSPLTFATRSASRVQAAFDADHNGFVAGFPAGGLYPLWPDVVGGVMVVRSGNELAWVQGVRTNLAIVAEFPGTAGSNGGMQYVTVHFSVSADAQGQIVHADPLFATAGDSTINVGGRIMTMVEARSTVRGNLSGRFSGTADLSFFLDEPHATPGGLQVDHHWSSVSLEWDMPVQRL
jgi:hypothetical protein